MIDLIYCADGGPRFAEIAIRYGFKYGSQSAKTVYFPPAFIDYDFKAKSSKWIRHVADCKKYRPGLAIIPDWMESRRLSEIVDLRAVELAPYVGELLIVPKVKGGIDKLPHSIAGKPVRLAYSVPTGFGSTDVEISEFQGWPVHLLGGNLGMQMELAKQMNVVSADANKHKMKANYAEVWTGYYIKGDKVIDRYRQLQSFGFGELADAPYHAFALSCINIKAWWQGARCFIRYATQDDIPAIKAIADQYKHGDNPDLPFLNRGTLMQSQQQLELHVATIDDQIVGFVRWHKRKDGLSKIYDVAVDKDHVGQHIGLALVGAVPYPVQLCCPVTNKANGFYEHVGFRLIATEPGRKRQLNVWHKAA